MQEIFVPDIGDAKGVSVIEINVKVGDTVKVDDPLITLESEKATMEIPSPAAGKINTIKVKVGDKVSQGDLILLLESQQTAANKTSTATEPSKTTTAAPITETKTTPTVETKAAPAPEINKPAPPGGEVYAGPGVRRMARELGVDLNLVTGSGAKNRIVKEDVQQFVKTALSKSGSAGSGFALPAAPIIDFSQFGAIETVTLNRIKKLTATHVHRSWLTVPHVTQFGEADITELEEFRQQQKTAMEARGIKLTPLVFIMKAVVSVLKNLPTFNSSLINNGEQLAIKKYYHIGVAVETPNGLVVPVLRNVDQKSIYQLAEELAHISAKARDKGLAPADMQGSSFTISSLGGIGGIAFTPIVNMPDVAILGVSKASMKPVYQHGEFVPRLLLPLSLSYDHRVIDGAEGARFIVQLADFLADIRTLLL